MIIAAQTNAEKIRACRERNPARAREVRILWETANREKLRRQSVETSRRYNQSRKGAILRRLRTRLRDALRGKAAMPRVEELVGTTQEELVQWVEQQFLPGMSWDNRHLWHIDHIKPCAMFDLARPEQQRACFHYTNLRPLWAQDNRAKGARAEHT